MEGADGGEGDYRKLADVLSRCLTWPGHVTL